METVDEHVFVGHDDGAVLAFEAEAVAILCGLYAVDEDQLATTFFVVDILHLLLSIGEGHQEGN